MGIINFMHGITWNCVGHMVPCMEFYGRLMISDPGENELATLESQLMIKSLTKHLGK